MWIVENWQMILTILSYVVTIAAAIASVTPSPKDDGYVAMAKKIIDVLALNVGQAKNASSITHDVKKLRDEKVR